MYGDRARASIRCTSSSTRRTDANFRRQRTFLAAASNVAGGLHGGYRLHGYKNSETWNAELFGGAKILGRPGKSLSPLCLTPCKQCMKQ